MQDVKGNGRQTSESVALKTNGAKRTRVTTMRVHYNTFFFLQLARTNIREVMEMNTNNLHDRVWTTVAALVNTPCLNKNLAKVTDSILEENNLTRSPDDGSEEATQFPNSNSSMEDARTNTAGRYYCKLISYYHTQTGGDMIRTKIKDIVRKYDSLTLEVDGVRTTDNQFFYAEVSEKTGRLDTLISEMVATLEAAYNDVDYVHDERVNGLHVELYKSDDKLSNKSEGGQTVKGEFLTEYLANIESWSIEATWVEEDENEMSMGYTSPLTDELMKKKKNQILCSPQHHVIIEMHTFNKVRETAV